MENSAHLLLQCRSFIVFSKINLRSLAGHVRRAGAASVTVGTKNLF